MIVRQIAHRHGRRVTFSKRLDAAILFQTLRLAGVPYRQAATAIEALLGVDGRELHRALSAGVEPAGEDHLVLLAIGVLSNYRDLIAERIDSAETGAMACVEELPGASGTWLREQLAYCDIHIPPRNCAPR